MKAVWAEKKAKEKLLTNSGGSGIIKAHEYSEPAKAIIEKCQANNVDFNKVNKLTKILSSDEIIQKISGGDMTKGSCSSAAFAYIGNRCGLDVVDFRGGSSQDVFSDNDTIKKLIGLPNVKGAVTKAQKEIKGAIDVLNSLEKDKEYYFAAGKHAAIVRRSEKGVEYLELQSATRSGWQPFSGGTYGTANNTLYKRFGCRKTVDKSFGKIWEKEIFLAEVDSFNDSLDFEHLLGYINTAVDKQKKGVAGNVK